MSFERSIIVPYKMYKKCKLPTKDTDSVDILTNETLPSDRKLKLYNQAVLSETTKSTTPPPSATPLPLTKGRHILHNIPDKDKPVARSILDLVHNNDTILDYNDNLEVIIDGQSIYGSNLINILLYLTNNVPVTSEADIPKGATLFHDHLLELGMPPVWIRLRRGPKKRSSTRLEQASKSKKAKWDSL
jgi:hypothetical protein